MPFAVALISHKSSPEDELALPGSLGIRAGWGAMRNRRLIDGESRDAMSEGFVPRRIIDGGREGGREGGLSA